MIPYRKDIDGLRAIAVLLAILFHYNTPGLERGFIGVDIFFVISGFLIGSIILASLDNNTFSFTGFYVRRTKRILPALYTIIIAAVLFAFFFLDSLFLKESAKSALSSILFVSNIHFYQTTGGYIEIDNGNKLFLHTWSLSLEEQYYIFFPLFAWFIHRYAKKYFLHAVTAVTLLSLGLSIGLSKEHPGFSYYLPFTRIWEFMAGVLLVKLNVKSIRPAMRQLLSVAGILMIAIGLWNGFAASGFPGYSALFPVAGTASLIAAGSGQPAIVNKILSFPPLVFLGKISYSLYLWHWPIAVYAAYIFPTPLQATDIITLLSITLVLSVLSWRFIEQPFRKKETPHRKKVFMVAGLASLVLIAITSLTISNDGFPGSSERNKLLADQQQHDLWPTTWFFHGKTLSVDSTKTLPILGDRSAEPDLLLWGDSHAGMQLPGYEAALIEKRKSSYIAVTVGDPPRMPIYTKGWNPRFDKITLAIIQFVADHPGIKKIFLTGRWSHVRRHSSITGDNSYQFDEEFRYIIDKLSKLNREVIIMGPFPELVNTPQQYLARSTFSGKVVNTLAPVEADFFKQHGRTISFLKTLETYPGVRLIDIHSIFYENNHLLINDKGHLMYSDSHHISLWGGLLVKAEYLKYL